MTGPNTAGEEREVRLADDDDEKGCDCRFAVVDRAGVVARGKGVVSAARLAPGQYEVIFNRSVRNCAYVATVGDVDDVGVEQPGRSPRSGALPMSAACSSPPITAPARLRPQLSPIRGLPLSSALPSRRRVAAHRYRVRPPRRRHGQGDPASINVFRTVGCSIHNEFTYLTAGGVGGGG